jgi:hypothetical protein
MPAAMNPPLFLSAKDFLLYRGAILMPAPVEKKQKANIYAAFLHYVPKRATKYAGGSGVGMKVSSQPGVHLVLCRYSPAFTFFYLPPTTIAAHAG